MARVTRCEHATTRQGCHAAETRIGTTTTPGGASSLRRQKTCTDSPASASPLATCQTTCSTPPEERDRRSTTSPIRNAELRRVGRTDAERSGLRPRPPCRRRSPCGSWSCRAGDHRSRSGRTSPPARRGDPDRRVGVRATWSRASKARRSKAARSTRVRAMKRSPRRPVRPPCRSQPQTRWRVRSDAAEGLIEERPRDEDIPVKRCGHPRLWSGADVAG